jgi:hypothetical protein
VKLAGDYRLHVEFEDGIEGVVDVDKLITFAGVFAPLRDPSVFGQVYVNSELGTICWPNGADLDPDVLYAEVTGIPIAARVHPIAPPLPTEAFES